MLGRPGTFSAGTALPAGPRANSSQRRNRSAGNSIRSTSRMTGVARNTVSAGGLTDVGVAITVTDTVGLSVKTYKSTKGTLFQPFADTSAFDCP